MNLPRATTARLLETLGLLLWGFRPNLMRHIVEQHGARQALLWFLRNMPPYERTLKAWGGVRTHLITAAISVLNGCPYCTYGHAYALELHYLRATGHLLPSDEQTIVAWHRLDESASTANLRELAQSVGLEQGCILLERLLELRQGTATPSTADDQRLMQLLTMFSFLNRCGIRGHTPPDQAHDPINKDVALRATYQRLRSAATHHA